MCHWPLSPILVYYVDNYRLHLSHFCANMTFSRSHFSHFLFGTYLILLNENHLPFTYRTIILRRLLTVNIKNCATPFEKLYWKCYRVIVNPIVTMRPIQWEQLASFQLEQIIVSFRFNMHVFHCEIAMEFDYWIITASRVLHAIDSLNVKHELW